MHYKYAPDGCQVENTGTLSQDAVRAKRNLIRDSFKDQFRKAEERKGLKESLFSLSGDSSAPKKETKEGRRGGGFGREEEEKG